MGRRQLHAGGTRGRRSVGRSADGERPDPHGRGNEVFQDPTKFVLNVQQPRPQLRSRTVGSWESTKTRTPFKHLVRAFCFAPTRRGGGCGPSTSERWQLGPDHLLERGIVSHAAGTGRWSMTCSRRSNTLLRIFAPCWQFIQVFSHSNLRTPKLCGKIKRKDRLPGKKRTRQHKNEGG